jgi:hypothetical protein
MQTLAFTRLEGDYFPKFLTGRYWAKYVSEVKRASMRPLRPLPSRADIKPAEAAASSGKADKMGSPVISPKILRKPPNLMAVGHVNALGQYVRSSEYTDSPAASADDIAGGQTGALCAWIFCC